MIKRYLQLIIVFASLITSAYAEDLRFSHGWVAQGPAVAQQLAGYLKITNQGSHPVYIVAASSDQFTKVELHETKQVNGIMRMRPVERLAIDPKQTVTLKPGGLHLMLIKPHQPLTEGEMVQLHLLLANGHQLTTALAVRPAHGHHHHH